MEVSDIGRPLLADQRHTAEAPAVLRKIVERAGIRFNGDAPWDIQI